MEYRPRKGPVFFAKADRRLSVPFEDDDDLPPDSEYQTRLWECIAAIALMGPASVALCILTPVTIGLCVVYIHIWMFRWAKQLVSPLALRAWRMVQAIFRILFDFALGAANA